MSFETTAEALRESSGFQAAKAHVLQTIETASRSVQGIRSARSEGARARYAEFIHQFQAGRGRDLIYPYVASGLGAGPYVELIDGSVKLDMISGIGVNFFGHTHPALMSVALDALASDTMQGNLQPGCEQNALLAAVLSRVGKDSRLKHGWFLCSGTMSNEIALKIVRQKHAPATKILAFEDCFAGRSTAMQEITDNPGYREGQPTYGEVQYLPFYDRALGLQASIDRTLDRMRGHLSRAPGKFAAVMMELVLGEGGFRFAPREFYVRVFEEAKKSGLAIWLDEIQTFGRTGELFAYQTLGLSEWPDVVTVGKMLQACMVLYSAEYNPKPGLVAGTFAGSSVALRTGKKVLELLDQGGFLGPDGRIAGLSSRFVSRLEALREKSCKGKIGEIRALGGMIAFDAYTGKLDEIKGLLLRCFDQGLIVFYCGHGPYSVRLLPPLGAMTEENVDEVCAILERGLLAS